MYLTFKNNNNIRTNANAAKTMSRSNDAAHFFQTSDALATTERKVAKATNKHGKPIKLPSKILAACADPADEGVIYVAEAAGDEASDFGSV